MRKHHLVLGVISAALLLAGFGCFSKPSPPPEPSPAPAPAPSPEQDPESSFGAQSTLAVGASLKFDDGLVVLLEKIEDSRCPKDVQCIWAGELSPVFRLSGGTLTAPQELRLGTSIAQNATVGGYAFALQAATESSATIMVTKGAPPSANEDRIRVSEPRPDALVMSPLKVAGQARGTWYFEASFPVKLLDADGNVLVQAPAQAQGEWMTQDFVPFAVSLAYKKPATATGTLVLEKDNPSGLPEHDAEVRIPIRFAAEPAPVPKPAVGGCRPSGCSGEICSDEETMSTCIFKPEYACYRSATCARQADGACGWTMTPQLTACLTDPETIQ